MAEPSTSKQGVVLRERSGLGAPIALMLFAAVFSVAPTGLLLLVPLALLMMAAPPRRPVYVLMGAALLVLGLAGQSSDVLWWFGRGWALMLGALFLVITVLRPESTFLDRALGAVLGTAIASAILLAVRSGWSVLDGTIADRLRAEASAAEQQFAPKLAEWNLSSDPVQAMYRVADFRSMVFPAFLALGSVATLAVAWWLWRRLTARDANPLAALPEFRFRDELIWVMVTAVLLLVLPLGEIATRAGANLAVFMGALYALRGVAVLFAFVGTPGPFVLASGVVIGLVLFPMLFPSAVVLGLADTWMDLRTRLLRPRPPK